LLKENRRFVIYLNQETLKMDELKYEKIGEANSPSEVELVEASVSHAYYVMPMARVEIFVPREKSRLALKLLKPFDDIQPGDEE
jgi:hypothetical protein